MRLKLHKDDIFKVGDTIFQDKDGNTSFVIAADSSYHLHTILLRHVLTLYGKRYRIIKEEDFGTDGKKEVTSMKITTNLPYKVVKAYHGIPKKA